jgi:hypothetical protein
MKLIENLKTICENPHLFHTNSSENIFWFTFGFSVADKKLNNSKNFKFAISLSNYFNYRYINNGDYFNWGILLKYISETNKDSIILFMDNLNNFLKLKYDQYDTNKFERKVVEVTENTDYFYSVLQHISTTIENTEQLQFFIYGYILGANSYDKEAEKYEFNKIEMHESILKELNLPIHLNCLGQLYNHLYPPNEAVKFYIKKTIQYNVV